MWRAIRRTDGKVLFQDANRSKVESWIRRMNAGFFATIDHVGPAAAPRPLRYFG